MLLDQWFYFFFKFSVCVKEQIWIHNLMESLYKNNTFNQNIFQKNQSGTLIFGLKFNQKHFQTNARDILAFFFIFRKNLSKYSESKWLIISNLCKKLPIWWRSSACQTMTVCKQIILSTKGTPGITSILFLPSLLFIFLTSASSSRRIVLIQFEDFSGL